MNRQTLADVLQDTNQTGSYTLATVLEGAETGSQLLLRDGNAVWQTPNAGLLQRQLAALQQWEGDRIFLRLMDEHVPFFSLKLVYAGDTLTEAVLNGKRLERS